MALSSKITPPFQFFPDFDGTPLENGKIYIGLPNLEPTGNPTPVYSDAELTNLVSQPVRTSGGRPYDNNTNRPIDLYVESDDYSILIRDKNDRLINSKLSVKTEPYERQFTSIAQLKAIADQAIPDGTIAETLGYYSLGDGGANRFYWDSALTETDNGGTVIKVTAITTGRWKAFMRGSIRSKQFGTRGDGLTDDTVAVQAAVDAAVELEVPLIFDPGYYVLESQVSNQSEKDLTLIGSSGVIIEPKQRMLFSVATESRVSNLIANIDRKDKTITLSDASGITAGDVVHLRSSIVVENLRNRPHRFTAKVTSISGGTLSISDGSTLNFHLGDTALDLLVTKGRRVQIEDIEFIQSSSFALHLVYCTGLIRNVTLKGPLSGTVSMCLMDQCYEMTIRDCKCIDGFYGFNLQACFNMVFRDLYATNIRAHPIIPSFWTRRLYVYGLIGEGNQAIMDAHESFDVNYSDVYTDSDQNYSNIRSAGGSFRNSRIRSDLAVATNIYFQNIDFVTTPHDYSSIYDEVDFTVQDVVWKSLDRFGVDRGNNVIIRNSQFLDENDNDAAIVIASPGGGVVNNLSIVNTRFDEAGSLIRCPRNDAREIKTPGIVTAVDTGTYDGALIGSGNITTAGTGYSNASGVALTGGTGSGATVDIVTTAGAVTSATFADYGTGYSNSDVLTISGGGGDAEITVDRSILCINTFAVKSGVMGEFGGGFSKYSALLKDKFTSGGDVVFCLQVGWPRNNLDNGGASGYSFAELSFMHCITHGNSGFAEVKRTIFQGIFGNFSTGVWSTPALITDDTGQGNTSMQMDFVGSISTFGGQAFNSYYNAFFKISSGRTNPQYSALVELTLLKRPL